MLVILCWMVYRMLVYSMLDSLSHVREFSARCIVYHMISIVRWIVYRMMLYSTLDRLFHVRGLTILCCISHVSNSTLDRYLRAVLNLYDIPCFDYSMIILLLHVYYTISLQINLTMSIIF